MGQEMFALVAAILLVLPCIGNAGSSEIHAGNIVPQKSALNQGSWERLESAVRCLVGQYGTVWVMTGPLYERDVAPLPGVDEPHKVPSGFWKIVVVQPKVDAQSIRTAAFIFDQETPRNANLLDQLKTIREVETRSHLEFLRLLPTELQDAVETAKNRSWVQDEF